MPPVGLDLFRAQFITAAKGENKIPCHHRLEIERNPEIICNMIHLILDLQPTVCAKPGAARNPRQLIS